MKLSSLMLATAAAALLAAPQADARERHFGGVITGSRGGQSTVSRDVWARGRDRSASTTVTGPQGRTRQVDTARDIDPGQRSASRDVTYADGSTRSVDRSATRTGPGEWSIERDVTGRNGETRNVATDRTRTGNDVHVDRTVTQPDGDTRTRSGDFVITPHP
ncbi:MAG: hypothetical protein QM759_01865 [Terricaulis sp.]